MKKIRLSDASSRCRRFVEWCGSNKLEMIYVEDPTSDLCEMAIVYHPRLKYFAVMDIVERAMLFKNKSLDVVRDYYHHYDLAKGEGVIGFQITDLEEERQEQGSPIHSMATPTNIIYFDSEFLDYLEKEADFDPDLHIPLTVQHELGHLKARHPQKTKGYMEKGWTRKEVDYPFETEAHYRAITELVDKGWDKKELDRRIEKDWGSEKYQGIMENYEILKELKDAEREERRKRVEELREQID